MATDILQGGRESAPAITRLDEDEEAKQHAQEHSSRTSLTLSGSWDISAMTTVSESSGTGIAVPAFLQPFLGMDFVPFAPGIPEEDPTEPDVPVPRSVEISEDQQSIGCPEPPGSPVREAEDDYEISVHSLERVCSPAPKPEDTQELRELLLDRQQSERKKKKRGLKAAARAVLHRVSVKKKASKRGKLKLETASAPLPSVHLDQQQQHESEEHWISPSATAITEGTLSPISYIREPKDDEKLKCLRRQAKRQEDNIQETHGEIEDLQSKLAASIAKYQSQLADFQITQKQLEQMVQQVSVPSGQEDKEAPEQAAIRTAGQRRVFKRSESGSFMRVHDLDLGKSSVSNSSDDPSVSSLSQSGRAESANQPGLPTPDFLLMDHYLIEIVQQLIFVGFELATDEGDRYTPTRDTEKLISQTPANSCATKNQNGWPIQPWTHAIDEHILVWTGRVSHDGFGHTWPVVKGRAILHASAKRVLEYLWDSSLVPKYNPLCQGRDDVYTLQDDVETTAHESPYGFTGCAKIVRSLNKHRLLPKGIEMKSLLYARPFEKHTGSYILVSRSVWENDTATLDSKAAKTVIRTEMLLGCTIMRALDDNTCEMTQLSHVHMPGVPEMVARRTAPNQCYTLMKALQSQFPPP